MSDMRALARFAREMAATMRWRLLVLFGFGLLSGVTAGVGLVMMVPLLGLIGVETGGGTTEPFVQYVVTALDRLGLSPTASALLGLNALVLVGTAVLRRVQDVVETRIYEDFVHGQRARLFEALTLSRWRLLASEKAASNLHLLTREVDRLGGIAGRIVSLVTKVLMVLVHLGVAIVLSPLLTALVVVTGLVLAVVSAPLTQRAKERGRDVSAAFKQLYAVVSDHLTGLKTVKAHGAEPASLLAFGARSRGAADAVVSVASNHANVGLLLQTGSVVMLSGIIWLALGMDSVTPAGMLLLVYLFARLVPMLTGLQRSYQSLLSSLPALELVEEALDRFAPAREPDAGPDIAPLHDAIALDGVTFAYEPGREALRGVSLTVPVGKTTAIVGASGGGKSTVADVLIGLLEPDAGQLLLDGRPLTPAQRPAWRRRVAYVAQDVFLFHDTIRSNLLLADPGADEARLWEALEAASAGFVRELPEGLDTVVGDRGTRLSGGERQRLALARALLRDPELLVLDEATSSLDAVNEARVQEAIRRLHGRVTLVVIAHRLATVRDADTVHVMAEGRLVESGTWRELYGSEGGALRELASAQGLSF